MIKIKSFFEKELIDEVNYTGNLGDYFDSIDEYWRKRSSQPVEVYLNGNHLSPVDFDSVNVSSLCNVEIYILPKGGLLKPIGKLFGGVLNFAFGWLMPSSRSSQRSRVNTPQGDRLELSSIKSNNPRLGSVVPECFGRYRRYFDSLNQPRRYFVNKRQQEITGVLCVGVGEYDSEPLHIGDTPFSDMSNSSYKWFNPNEDLTDYYENWHTVSEIGATSNGTAGIELSVESAKDEDMENIDPDSGYTFSGENGSIITRNDDSNFNQNWVQGITIEIGTLKPYYHYTTLMNDGRGTFWWVAMIRGDFTNFPTNGSLLNIFPERVVLAYGRFHTAKPVFFNKDNLSDAIVVYQYDWANDSYYVFADNFYNYDFPENETIELLSGKNYIIGSVSGSTLTVNTSNDLTDLNNENVKIKYISGASGVPQWTNLYKATPSGVKTKELEIDFFFPSGLCWITDEGWLWQNSAPVEIEVYDSLTGVRVFNQRKVYVDATNDEIGFTEKIILDEAIEPSVRIRRTERGFDGVQFHSTVVWFGLKSRLPDVKKYPKWTTVGFTMQTGGKISSQSESLVNSIITRKLPVLQDDGTWSNDNKSTRDIASFVRYIAHAIGYTDNDIDMDELKRLHNQFWKPRNEYFDYIFDETTVKQAIDLGLNAGLSDLTISNGKIKPVRDDIRTVYEQVYSAQNVTSDITHTFKTREDRAFDGVEVEFVEYPSFENKTIICALPDSEKIKLRKVQIKGVTDIDKAYVIGMRLASEDRYVNREFSFKTEMDAFNSEYMSYIAVVIDDPKYSQSCQILQVNDDHLVLSEKIRNNPDTFAFRDERGKLVGPYDIISISENKVYVNLDVKPKVSLNRELPHAFLGTKERWSYPCLIDDITPSSTNSATVKASIYDSRVYAYDNEVYQ